MKPLYFIFCVLPIVTYAGLSESSRNPRAPSGSFCDFNDCMSRGRTKRGLARGFIMLGTAMIKGLRARQKLLENLKPFKKYKSFTFYKKNGGIQKMIDDFDAVNPTNVHGFKLSGKTVGKQGRVGDRIISYDTGDLFGNARISISRMTPNGETYYDIIDYQKIR